MLEVTVIEPREHDEIMVNIDMDTKKIVQVYAYAKYLPTLINERTGKEREARSYEMKNSLYRRLHIGDFKAYANQTELVTCLTEPDDEENYCEETNDLIKESFAEHLPSINIL